MSENNNETIQITCQTKDSLPLDKLQDFQGQLKTIDKKNLTRLKNRIKKVGINVPVFVWNNEGKYYLLDGHQRTKALKSLKKDGYTIPKIPVVYIEASDKEDAKEKLLAISSQYGDFQMDILSDFSIGLDIEDLRLTKGSIPLDYNNRETEGDDDEVVDEDNLNIVVKDGDIIKLGDHTLICGDSTKEETYTKLVGDKEIQLVITDPPYNMNYSGSPTTKRENIQNDHIPDFNKFLRNFISETMKVVKDAAWYIFMGREEYWNLRQIVKELLGKVDSDIIWYKGKITLGGSDYQKIYENCLYVESYERVLYGHNSDEKKYFKDDRTQKDVWEIASINSKKVSELASIKGGTGRTFHPTTKPLKTFTLPMKNSSEPGFRVIDPFAGSGTIFLAAEKMKRIAYGIEMDPKYCSYIILRYLSWCELNGIDKKATINGHPIQKNKLLNKGV